MSIARPLFIVTAVFLFIVEEWAFGIVTNEVLSIGVDLQQQVGPNTIWGGMMGDLISGVAIAVAGVGIASILYLYAQVKAA